MYLRNSANYYELKDETLYQDAIEGTWCFDGEGRPRIGT